MVGQTGGKRTIGHYVSGEGETRVLEISKGQSDKTIDDHFVAGPKEWYSTRNKSQALPVDEFKDMTVFVQYGNGLVELNHEQYVEYVHLDGEKRRNYLNELCEPKENVA